MSNLIVVNNPRDWPLDIPGVTVVPARAYLTDPAYGEGRSLKVFNLCRSYRYQSLGYYVSLLAEARGHKPLPRVSTMEDLQSQNLVRLLTEDPHPREHSEHRNQHHRKAARRGRQLARQHRPDDVSERHREQNVVHEREPFRRGRSAPLIKLQRR